MITEIKLPELGENIETAEVLSVLVSPGSRVEKDQPVMELETDKATAEVPSDAAGVVVEVRVKQGDEVRVGQTILTLETEGGATEASEAGRSGTAAEAKAKPAEPAPQADMTEETAGTEAPPKTPPSKGKASKAPVSKGNGRGEKEATKRGPEPTAPEEPSRPAASERPATPADAGGPSRASAPAPPNLSLVQPRQEASEDPGDLAPASPSVRRLARELGIDVTLVPGTGPGARISEDDVKLFARRLIVQSAQSGIAPVPAAPSGPAREAPGLPDFSTWGEVEREPASKVRRVTAEAMALSWSVIPHVTQFDRADVTDLESWRKRQAPRVEEAGGKLTVTAIAVKVLASALRVFPKFNASYDARQEEIVYKKFVNIGVAVDTEHGLLVPVVRDADQKNITQIAAELGDMAGRARARKIAIEELQGAGINLSNLGGLGTTYFSPIIQWPQVAVLGLGRATQEAVHQGGTFVPRLILPLSVSYDHRVIDGADAARFLRWIAEALEQPILLALEG